MFIGKTVYGDMCQIEGRELEMMGVHGQKLVNAIKEEDEIRCIVFAVVNVWPLLHLLVRCLDIVGEYLPVGHLSIAPLQKEGRSLGKVVLEEEPLFVNENSESFKRAVVRVDQ